MNRRIHELHIRYWRYGQIAFTAKSRIQQLLKCNGQLDAKSMINEWIVH